MSSASTDAEQIFLERFRWVDGHADFSRVWFDRRFIEAIGPALTVPFADRGITAVVGVEARGFVLGALCASTLNIGLVLARKSGSVNPGNPIKVTSNPDWRGRQLTFEVQPLLTAADRVLIVDDWIETGSQATAIADAVATSGAEVCGVSVIVDQCSDDTRRTLNVCGLVCSDQLPPHESIDS